MHFDKSCLSCVSILVAVHFISRQIAEVLDAVNRWLLAVSLLPLEKRTRFEDF